MKLYRLQNCESHCTAGLCLDASVAESDESVLDPVIPSFCKYNWFYDNCSVIAICW